MISHLQYHLAFLFLAIVQFIVLVQAETPNPDLLAKWGTDFSFSGISTFAHLPHWRCLVHSDQPFDIAVVGVPFDTAVTYRTGARFGPRAIRDASARQSPLRGFNARGGINPYREWATIADCGDIPVTPFDNALALRQMSEGFLELGSRSTKAASHAVPKLVTLGGDHSIALPALRALRKIHGRPITVVHFDAHLDTWRPDAYPSAWLDKDTPIEDQQSAFTHGTMFWLAWKEGLIANGTNVHAGLRTRLTSLADNESDDTQGWVRFASDEIAPDALGPKGLARRILEVVGTDAPVYLSVDIDVLDPGLAPGTGTPEPGGWLTRELVQLLRGVEELNLVGADVVEVAPAYDGQGEQTALAAAQVVFEILTSMVKRGIRDGQKEPGANLRDEL